MNMNILLICCTLMFISVCITFMMNRKIADRLHRRTMFPETELPKSPYGISREIGNSGDWGYCITKNGKIQFSDNGNGGKTAPVFNDFNNALIEMNRFEKIEGYKVTKV